ncbi:hypothetical protein ACWNS2_10130 [Planococcus plakortidis]
MNEVLSKICRDEKCRRRGELLSLECFYKSKTGYLGTRAICKECHGIKYARNMQRASRKRKERIQSLPNTLTVEEEKQIYARFNSSCALTKSVENLELDHFVPLAWGTHVLEFGIGGTIYSNMLPLNSSVNLSKWSYNPFEWISKGSGQFSIDMQEWEHIVEYMATKNEMTKLQYEIKVSSCHKLVLVEQNIRWLERLCHFKKPPYFLIEYLLDKGINIDVAVKNFGGEKSILFLRDEKTRSYIKEVKASKVLKISVEE